MSDLLEIIIRTSASFILLMIVAHILGKQTISQMTYHDFIAAIMIGAITANMAFNIQLKFWNIITSLIVFSFITFLIALLSLKSRTARKWFSGEPTVVMENGKILENNLKKLKYTMDSLNQALREKEIFNIEEIEYAILEPDGHLSILKKAPYRNVTLKDLSILTSVPKENFPVELIMDGKIIEKNLEENKINKEWLYQELDKRSVSVKDVFYAVRGTNNQLVFDFYADKVNSPTDIQSGLTK